MADLANDTISDRKSMQTSDMAENETSLETGSHKRLTRGTCATRNAHPLGSSRRTPAH